MKGKSCILFSLLLAVLVAMLLGGCTGGSDSATNTSPEAETAVTVAGAGVKGPLAGAVVSLYRVDLSATDLKGSILDQGSTDAAAAIQGLALPADTSGLVVVEVVADADTIDITSGAYPVLDTLYTVVDAQRIIDGDAVYATPLTTMAVKLARAKADTGAPYAGDGNDTITQAEFTAALVIAQRQVKSTLGFGLDSTIDIFEVPPLLTDDTDTAAEQEQVVRYRQAIEALAAVAQQVADDSTANDTPQQIFDALIDDLADGEIDGENSGVPVAALAALDTPIDTTLAGLDLSALTIPGTTTPVSDIEDQLAAEVAQTGAAVDTTDLESGAIAADLDPPELVADSDGDGVLDDLDAFPLDPTETVDTDGDGVGDNGDAFPNDPTETVDSDSDGVGDNADAFPSDPTEWLDSDSDGVGDNGDAFPNDSTEWLDTDSDGIGDNSDPDPLTPATVLTLDAVAEPGRVTLTWSEASAAAVLSRAAVASAAPRAAAAKIYNLYYATEPDCDIANYASCDGGMMVADVDSPYVVNGLANDQNYWFYVEAVGEGSNAVSDEKGAHPNDWMPNGSVMAIANDADGNVYLGGRFTAVGPYTGGGAPLSPTTGKTDGAYPRVDGSVNAVAADGAGGYYIGGSFGTVGGEPHTGLAHILANGTVDANWHPNTNGYVSALAVAGDTVYVGGIFTQINDGSGAQTRYRLAAIGTDGTLSDTWTLDTDNSGTVYSIAVLGSTVYVGGDFTTIGGTARSRLAAIGTDGTLNADWNPGANNVIYKLAVSSDTVYMGGGFSQVGGVSRSYLAAVSATGTGTVVDTWNPAPNGPPLAMVVSGSTVYLGGNFSTIGGVARDKLAAIGTDGTLSTTWTPSLTGSGISTLMVSGDTVYIGGLFSEIDGQTRSNLAAVGTDGTLSDWNPVANDDVRAVATSGDTVYAGGTFDEIGGEPRNHLAAYNTDGTLSDWNPDADDTVWTLAISGSTVYAGGQFRNVGGETRDYLAAIGTDGTLSTTWKPSADYNVYALKVSGSTVYAGGFFSTIDDGDGSGPQTRLSLAALDTTTGLLDANWHPAANDEVDAIAISGSTVYVGGWFTEIDDGSGPVARGSLAAIGTDGTLDTTTWIPDAGAEVYALAESGGVVYMGGSFTTIDDGKGGGAQTRNLLAAVDTSGNLSTAWAPSAGPVYLTTVYALNVWNNTIYAGGTFGEVDDGKGAGVQTRLGLAAIGTDGYLSSWAPESNNAVNAINVTTYGTSTAINVGGDFNTINGENALFYTTLAPAP